MNKKENNIFKPRDFIYINNEKLDSFFSQLFGGLIQNIDTSTQKGKEVGLEGEINAEALAKFGLEGSSNLVQMLLSQVGNFDASLKGDLMGGIGRTTTESSNTHFTKTLKHFQYSLFENSLKELNYLIDLDKVDNLGSSGQLRQKMKPTDFIKFKPNKIKVSDYRNVKNFVKIIKKIIDLSTEAKSGEIMDKISDEDMLFSQDIGDQRFKMQAQALIASMISENSGEGFYKKGKMMEVIIRAIIEIFSGDLIPLEVLLTSYFSVGKNGNVTFESQLKDDYLLEKRTDLSFKYSHFEDANWTIIGQITSLKGTKSPNIKKSIEKLTTEIEKITDSPENLDINKFVKTFIKKLDTFTKEIGLQPQVGEYNVALTPIAIYREPEVNSNFN